MWKLTRASVSKILEGWNREIYEKVQGWDTKRSNHKNYREKRGWLWQMILPIRKEVLDTQEVYNIGRDVRVKMQATGSKYVNIVYFDTDSGNTIGVNTRWSGCISNIMDDFIGLLVELPFDI